jgi:hypothetical protein
LAEAARQALNDAFFPAAQLGEVNLGVAELDTPILGLVGFLDQLGYVQQRF